MSEYMDLVSGALLGMVILLQAASWMRDKSGVARDRERAGHILRLVQELHLSNELTSVMIAELHKWHDARDADGRMRWWNSSKLETTLETLVATLQEQAVTGASQVEIMRTIVTSQDALATKIERVITHE